MGHAFSVDRIVSNVWIRLDVQAVQQATMYQMEDAKPAKLTAKSALRVAVQSAKIVIT